MKPFKYLFLLVIVLATTIASCKKQEGNMSRAKLLTSKPWRFLSSKTNGVADHIEDCEKDDFVIFAFISDYTWSPGGKKCDSQETIDTGTWTLSRDEKKITLKSYVSTKEVIATIVELTESILVFSFEETGYVWEKTYIAL